MTWVGQWHLAATVSVTVVIAMVSSSGVGSVDFGSHLCTSWNTISWMDYLTHCISHCVNSLGAFLLDAFVLVAKVGGVSLQFITNALA